MKIDIILIAYNQERYIAQAVKSIIMQQVDKNVEVRVIVADDCSDDKTLDIIKSYEATSPFPFVYLDNKTNVGHVLNYQRAFSACNGDYIAVRELSNMSQIFWGHIYVVVLDDYRMVKYLRRHEDPNKVILRSENPKYDDMEVNRSDIRDLLVVQNILHVDNRL